MKNGNWSKQELTIIGIFAREPGRKHYGHSLANITGIKGGVLYPILHRFATLGFLSIDHVEQGQFGRSDRTIYRITPDGVQAVADLRQLLF